MTIIAVVNKSTVVSSLELEAACAAVNLQISRDFAPFWLASATLVPKPAAESGDWLVVVADDSDQAGALGYHEVNKGEPMGFVFARTDKVNGLSWTVTLSHEVLEMLGDPWANELIQVSRLKFAAVELCDAVEADRLGYVINGVLVSDFVLPSWFIAGSKGPWSFRRSVKAPLSLAAGGYMSWWTPAREWTQTHAAAAPGVVSRVGYSSRTKKRLDG